MPKPEAHATMAYTPALRPIKIPDNKKLGKPVEPIGLEPELRWVNVKDLWIDDCYQRKIEARGWKAIRNIALDFRWSHFGCVNVAELEDGRLVIIDAQHRAHAAMMCGVERVPCLVRPMTLAEQARAFAAINGSVTQITVWSIYKASLVAGEPWAVAAEQMVREAGCTLMTKNGQGALKEPGQIYCITYMRKTVENGKQEEIGFALKALRESDWGNVSSCYTHTILRAVLEAVSERYCRFKDRFDEVVEALDDIDLESVVDDASQNVTIRKRTGAPPMSKWELMRAAIGTALDKRLPVSVTWQAPEASVA